MSICFVVYTIYWQLDYLLTYFNLIGWFWSSFVIHPIEKYFLKEEMRKFRLVTVLTDFYIKIIFDHNFICKFDKLPFYRMFLITRMTERHISLLLTRLLYFINCEWNSNTFWGCRFLFNIYKPEDDRAFCYITFFASFFLLLLFC